MIFRFAPIIKISPAADYFTLFLITPMVSAYFRLFSAVSQAGSVT